MTENEKDQKYLEAKNMWNNGNISDALDLLYYLSKEEHAESQLFYGMIFIQRKDIDEAYFWLKKAADNGSKDALELLRTGGINYTPQKPSSSSAPNSGGSSAQSNVKIKCQHCGFVNEKDPFMASLSIIVCDNCKELIKCGK
jgi:TPR repeat protein